MTEYENHKKVAIVTGAPGQDAFYLTSLLLELGYHVICTYRYSSSPLQERLKDYPDSVGNADLEYRCLDISDPSGVSSIIAEVEPDEVYNLAAASHVGESFKNPYSVFDVNTIGVLNWLNAIVNIYPSARFYQASTSELFGSNYTFLNNKKFQDENTPLSPNSPYGVSKLAAHNLVRIYRDSYNIYACAGVLMNHESPHRGEQFVTRKITKWLGEFVKWTRDSRSIVPEENDCRVTTDDSHDIHLVDEFNNPVSKFPKLRLGNVRAVRDWSHARDMVRGMHLMLQQEKPQDFVLCSGKSHSILDFMQVAFNEIGVKDCSEYWIVDPKFYRPCEVEYLQGKNTKARSILEWRPEISFEELVKEMVDHDRL